MNIFKVLSSYDGKIYEPSISALLAYLLNPNEDHGFGNYFLKKIVAKLGNQKEKNNQKLNDYLHNSSDYKVKKRNELPVDVRETTSGKSKRYIDIVIEFYSQKDSNSDENESIPEFAIAIENKIRDDSLSDIEQISDEMSGLKKIYDDDEKDYPELHCILICPEYNDKVTKSLGKISDYNNTHLLWKGGDGSITQILTEMLEDEANGTITTLSTDTKYIVQSFIEFINNDFQSDDVKAKESRERVDYGGKLIREYLLEIYDGMVSGEEYDIKKKKDELSKKVKDGSGQILDASVRSSQFYKVTVNAPCRVNLGIKEPLNDKLNLFYYSDDSRKMIKKFDKTLPEVENITIYWKEDGVESKTLAEIRAEKKNNE